MSRRRMVTVGRLSDTTTGLWWWAAGRRGNPPGARPGGRTRMAWRIGSCPQS